MLEQRMTERTEGCPTEFHGMPFSWAIWGPGWDQTALCLRHAPPQIILSILSCPGPQEKDAQTENDKAINDFAVAFDGKEFWWSVHIHTWEEVQLHMVRKERWVWEKNKGLKSLLTDITQK